MAVAASWLCMFHLFDKQSGSRDVSHIPNTSKDKGINFSILRFFPLLYSQVENKQSGSKAGPCAPVIDELL